MSAEVIAGLAVVVVTAAGLGIARHLARLSDAAAREVDRLDAEIARRHG